jgi:hypothetical protein
MAKRILVEVPSTMEMGNYKTTVTGGFNQSFRQEALQDYNSARGHDGLPPLRKMPRGTKYYEEVVGLNVDGTNNYMYVLIK